MKNKEITAPFGLHWFRRDLRLRGNPGLCWNLEKTRGRVLGIFFFDGSFLARPDFSANRFAFFMASLKRLQEELRERGGDLLVLDGGPEAGFQKLFELLSQRGHPKPATLSFNRDYEPFARARDGAIENFILPLGIELHTERDHLLVEPDEISKDGKPGSFYQVYSPFARRWFEKLLEPEVQNRIRLADKKPVDPCLTWAEPLGHEAQRLDQLESYIAENSKAVTIPIPPAGPAAARAALKRFQNKIDDYARDRDYPAQGGGSGLSIYFKNGSLTIAQAIAELELGREKFATKDGRSTFLRELCWREFYYHILFHCPWVEKQSFVAKYRNIQWENSKKHFELWKNGQTGYPVVDAAMRQLKQTGLMHNRARMIVASFLTKHLLIDWRWGDRYFMKMLLDGDMAANNGGWQWAASTGCDPQPYFRVFNPTLQGEKFDADGESIRRYVPELRALSTKSIHNPSSIERAAAGYPEPIVEHAAARLRAIRRYQ